MSGAIEKLISESEVVAHLYAVAGSVGEMIDAARAELAALRAENARLREALAFYGNEANWDDDLVHARGCAGWGGGYCDCGGEREDGPAIDRGERARSALSGAPAGIWLSLDQAREIEWAAEGCDVRGGEVTTYDACPACGGAHPRFEPNQPSQLGHATDCFLAAKIKQAEEDSHV